MLTAFYTMRQITLTFLGEPRTEAAEHAVEIKWTMTLPLVVLAIFSIAAGWSGIEEFPAVWRHFTQLVPRICGRDAVSAA